MYIQLVNYEIRNGEGYDVKTRSKRHHHHQRPYSHQGHHVTTNTNDNNYNGRSAGLETSNSRAAGAQDTSQVPRYVFSFFFFFFFSFLIVLTSPCVPTCMNVAPYEQPTISGEGKWAQTTPDVSFGPQVSFFFFTLFVFFVTDQCFIACKGCTQYSMTYATGRAMMMKTGNFFLSLVFY